MLTMSRRIALLTVLCAAAMPAAAQNSLSVSIVPDGDMKIDMRAYREIVIRQRLWSLEDQRRIFATNLATAADLIQSLVGRKDTRDRLLVLGIDSFNVVAKQIPTIELSRLQDALNLVESERDHYCPLFTVDFKAPLQEAMAARRQIQAIDAQIDELKKELKELSELSR